MIRYQSSRRNKLILLVLETLFLIAISFYSFDLMGQSVQNLRELKGIYESECYFTKIDQKNKEQKFDADLKKSCIALGDVMISLKNEALAMKAYQEGCLGKDYLSCVKVGDLYASSDKEQQARQLYEKACNKGVEQGCVKFKRKQSSDLLMWVAIFLIGAGVFIIARSIFIDESQFQASEQLEDTTKKEELGKHGIVLKYSRPFFRRYVTPIVSTFKWKNKIREKYKRPISSAGLSNVLTPDDFFSFKLFLIVGFPILFLGLRTFLEETWSLSLIPLIAVLGYFYPDIWIKGKIKQRQEEVLQAMPFIVDMLALTVEAGLDFVQAMGRVIEKAKVSALSEEFEILIREIKVGASRAEALRNMAWRIDLMQISSFCATLIAADQVGANIAPILKSLSAEVRQKKSTDIEKKGATASTKILFPMMALIMPAVFIVVFTPVILQFFGGK